MFNDTRVVPARILGRKASGGRVEMFLERPLPGCRALVQLRASKGARPGTRFATAGGEVSVRGRHHHFWEVELPAPTLSFFESHGAVPLPPYIHRPPDAADRERYQSVLARVPGAVAAPTASLHFDASLLAQLRARGVAHTLVTLHVGAGTFQPLRSDELAEHVMHPEWYEVSAAAAQAINATRAAGGRVVAVGTTVARALESAALESAAMESAAIESAARQPARSDAALPALAAETTLFIQPGHRFRVIDALLTNFHLPQSTLLVLVAALIGRERVLAAYAHAVRERYRFFSYGDAMLVFPPGHPPAATAEAAAP